ncbi:MAG TPA: glycosyltransferase [Lachnospiraceae bacterium]|nr:glycosyltransferase [Lachnospiraceae bacterium]
MEKPVLTIITVCFRAREQLYKTMESILCQTWTRLEYLVIDGGSDDGTKELLAQSEESFQAAGILFRFLSEPDQGIYDAMNKGSRMAEGKWLLFLNAGDLLAEEDVLERVFTDMREDADILYGDALCTYQGKTKIYPALPLDRLRYEMAFCHQSAFVLKELAAALPYDTSYKVCADHHFFLSAYLQGKRFAYRPFAVCIYEIAGYSDKNKMAAHREQHRMQKELNLFQPSFSWLRREAAFYLKQGIKVLFGQRLVDLVRNRRLN